MPEHQNIEWKPVWRTDWLEWVCGFANAQGSTLYIGTDDAGKVMGIKKPEKLLKDIPNSIKNSLGLVCDVNLLEKDGKGYIEIVVSAYTVPINYKGRFYYRSGGTNLLLEGVELEFPQLQAGAHLGLRRDARDDGCRLGPQRHQVVPQEGQGAQPPDRRGAERQRRDTASQPAPLRGR